MLSPDEQAEFEEPPVPAGLGRQTPALHQFARFFDLDRHLIQSAAAASPAQAPKPSEAALRRAIGTLPRAEADDFLVRLLGGEAGLAHALRPRLQAELQAPPRAAGGGRTAESLLAAAEQLKRDEAKQKAAAAEKGRTAELEKLVQTEEQAWQKVGALLAEKRWKAHEQAVTQLQQLRDLADYKKTRAVFSRRVKLLRAKHQSRAALMKRFNRANLPWNGGATPAGQPPRNSKHRHPPGLGMPTRRPLPSGPGWTRSRLSKRCSSNRANR